MKPYTLLIPRSAFTLLMLTGLICMSGLPRPARADTFTVNSTTDAEDAIPGDGACATSGGTCTLRAAIEESNALSGSDVVDLPAGTYMLELGQLEIRESLVLNGDGATSTFIDGDEKSRVLFIGPARGLLVSDSNNDTVLLFNQETGDLFDTIISSGSGGLDIPGATTFGPDNDLFVAGFSSGIHRYDRRTGSSKGLFVASGSGGLLGPSDLIFGPGFGTSADPDRNLYVTKFQPGGGILRYDRETGAFIDEFVAAGSGGLSGPNSLLFGRDGHLYVTSTNTDAVLRYNGETGAFIDEFVTAGSGGLDTPRGLVFGPDDNLYVASEGNDRVLRYDGETGSFIDVFVAAGSGGLDEPSEIAFGPDDNLYVISTIQEEILRYDGATGAFLGTFIPAGTDGLSFPSSLQFTSDVGRRPIVNISGVTIQNGKETGIGVPGGGIWIFSGSSLSLSKSVVRDNEARVLGGGIHNAGFLQLFDSAVRNNSVILDTGGGVQFSGGGILMSNDRTSAQIIQSTISGNEATRGGGVANFSGRLRITNSTISGNVANARGGGLFNFGGVADIAYTTITDNEANAIAPASASEPAFGGGIYNTERVSIGNSILAGNTDNRDPSDSDYSPDCWSGPTPGSDDPAFFTSFRGNVVGVLNENCDLRDTIFGAPPSFDQFGSPGAPLVPLLGPLVNNGGPTRTHALLAGSPAIDEGTGITSADFFDCPDADQRGYLRPEDGNDDSDADCDAGSYEFGAEPPGPVADATLPVCGEIEVVTNEEGVGIAVQTTATDKESGIASVTFTRLFNLTGQLNGQGAFEQSDSETFDDLPETVEIRGNRQEMDDNRAALVTVVENGAGLEATCDPVIETITAEAPEQFALKANYPNPFNPTTTIPFAVAEKAHVTLTVYDVMGRKVVTLIDRAMGAGSYEATWEAGELPSGLYLYRIEAGTFRASKAMTLVK